MRLNITSKEKTKKVKFDLFSKLSCYIGESLTPKITSSWKMNMVAILWFSIFIISKSQQLRSTYFLYY